MGFKSFLRLVEIQTKLASIFPIMLGSIYVLYRFQKFETGNFIILFLSMLTFDMFTTALNNYLDFKRANRRQGYNFESHNEIVKNNLNEKAVVVIIISLLAIAILLGLMLVYNTDIMVLLIGMVSFAAGICYSFGPLPISRTPLGEIISGFFMGFIIIFLSIYVHIYNLNFISIIYENSILSVHVKLIEVFYIFLFSIPAMCGIANIMLANNICDMEDDIANDRYTLPIYIGKKYALLLFQALYYISFLDIILLSALRVAPVIILLALFMLIPVFKNIKLFAGKQTKKDTFVLSVKNFMVISASIVLLMCVSIVIRQFI